MSTPRRYGSQIYQLEGQRKPTGRNASYSMEEEKTAPNVPCQPFSSISHPLLSLARSKILRRLKINIGTQSDNVEVMHTFVLVLSLGSTCKSVKRKETCSIRTHTFQMVVVQVHAGSVTSVTESTNPSTRLDGTVSDVDSGDAAVPCRITACMYHIQCDIYASPSKHPHTISVDVER